MDALRKQIAAKKAELDALRPMAADALEQIPIVVNRDGFPLG
jgi:hypothetical protein